MYKRQGIGIGEMIAGVKSPQREAHDDIKSIYGVDIPQNSGTIKQVVQIAQSQFEMCIRDSRGPEQAPGRPSAGRRGDGAI